MLSRDRLEILYWEWKSDSIHDRKKRYKFYNNENKIHKHMKETFILDWLVWYKPLIINLSEVPSNKHNQSDSKSK